MKWRYLICALAFVLGLVYAHAAPKLTQEAEISVLTCAPGDELYSVFGHSAFRVREPGRFDVVFNYGTFEFSEDFYIKFAQGKLNYALSRTNFSQFNYEYAVTERAVWEQVLDLDETQKQALFDFLEWNFMPENRYYLYDFFFDNCATRIRDVLDAVLHDELAYHSTFPENEITFRQMIDAYLEEMNWSDFGIDIALGAPCDEFLTAQQNMFLPDFVMQELSLATIGNRPLVREMHELIPAYPNQEGMSMDGPFWVTSVLAILTILWFFRARRGRQSLWWPRLLLFVVGLVGLLVFLLWFATDHTTTRNNLNLIWAFPLHVVMAFLISKPYRWLRIYFKTFTVIYLAFVLTGCWWPQQFHVALFPLALALLIVSYRLSIGPSGNSN